MRAVTLTTAVAALASFTLATDTCKQVAGKQISGLAVYAPDTKTPVTKGKEYTIKWEPTAGISTVSILLLKGPSTNVVPHGCIVNSIPNSGSYTWNVPSNLDAQESGYGLEIIADGSGDFQYSTQFGVKGKGKGNGSKKSGTKKKEITSTKHMSGSTIHTTVYHTRHHSSHASHTPHSSHHSSHPSHKTKTKTKTKKPHSTTHVPAATHKPHTRKPHISQHISLSANATHSSKPIYSTKPTVILSTGSYQNKTSSSIITPTKSISKPSLEPTSLEPTSLEPTTQFQITSLPTGSQAEATVTGTLSAQTTTPSAGAPARMVGAGALAGFGALAALVL